jgi:hypothetical protein
VSHALSVHAAAELRPAAPAGNLGIVVIGRNEGKRLGASLGPVLKSGAPVIYVDSGSTDDSTALATRLGAQVHALDPGRPFTAARARNEGWSTLLKLHPGIELVQFVDGDCEVHAAWLSSATGFMETQPKAAAVCGRLRERHPERSVYNELCDMEWNTPIGPAKACGGIAMVRVSALAAVKGYREDLIAGEEPELCVRLRQAGWEIWRIDAEMALHDAAMTRFSQWWRRAMRGGYAFAQGRSLHGDGPERHWVRESRSALTWGVWIPLATAGLVIATQSPLPLLGLLAYPLQMARMLHTMTGGPRERRLRALFLMIAKFPEGLGQLKYLTMRLLRRRGGLIEYK